MTTKYLFPILSERDKAYPVYVVTVGSENQQQLSRPNGIEHHQLLFTLDGSGEIKLGDKFLDVPANSVMYLKPGVPQYYYPVSEPWKVMWLTFVQNTAFDILSMENGIYKLPTIQPYINIINFMLKSTGTLNFSKNTSILLYNLLIELREHLSNINIYENRSKLYTAVEYIKQNYTTQIETPYLAELSKMTPEHFCRIFKQTYHMRPLEYIQILRFQDAKNKLISYPNMTVVEISESVGYTSPSYFIKQFKAKEGITPIEFRNMHRT